LNANVLTLDAEEDDEITDNNAGDARIEIQIGSDVTGATNGKQ
jgi:hypothetical protein